LTVRAAHDGHDDVVIDHHDRDPNRAVRDEHPGASCARRVAVTEVERGPPMSLWDGSTPGQRELDVWLRDASLSAAEARVVGPV
jgi:hypothetical protein